MKTLNFLCSCCLCLLAFCDVIFIRCRSVAAMNDICSRSGQMAICRASGQISQQQASTRQPDASYSLPPLLPVLSSSSSCNQFKSLGQVQCQNGSSNSVFCSAYNRLCKERSSIQDQEDLDCRKENLHYFFECTRQSLKLKEELDFCQRYQATCLKPGPQDLQQSMENIRKKILEQQIPVSGTRARNDHENSETLEDLCQKHKNLGSKFCTGFEVDEVRRECNYYRVYCLQKKPIPVPDGSVAINRDLWGIGGIPYYPFNPQGQISGGEKKNIHFGDWGAKVDTNKGVSDFFNHNEHSEVDWIEGSYDDSSVDWHVPVVGIHGYDHGMVKASGLANPGDWPSVFSGGIVEPGPPLKSLGEKIVEKGWTPPPTLT